MKILYVCTDPGIPVFGTKGASIHVREMVRALGAEGHEVLVAAAKARPERSARAGGPPAPPADGLEGAEVIEVDLDEGAASAWRAVAAQGGGREHAAAFRAMMTAAALPHAVAARRPGFVPDLIFERYALFGTAGLTLARQLGVPHFLEVNAPLVEEATTFRGLTFTEAAEVIEQAVVAGADRVFVVSRALGEWAAGLGADPNRVTVLPNGVDPRRFEPPAEDVARVRRELGLDSRPVVGFVGGLRAWHGVGTLLEAVKRMAGAGRPVQLLVVGDGPMRALLDEQTASLDLAGAVHFVGAVEHSAVPSHLAQMDLAVLPYPADINPYFSPLKLFEYLAAGRPVLAAKVGQVAEVIEHGVTGMLYPAGDVAALAALAATVLDNPALAARLSSAGKELVAARYTWAKNAKTVTQEVHDMLRAKGNPVAIQSSMASAWPAALPESAGA